MISRGFQFSKEEKKIVEIVEFLYLIPISGQKY